MKNLIKIEGDASFRKFFRKKTEKKNSIVVYAKKEKFKNLVVYDAVNKILRKNKILAPKLYNQNYHNHYMEIQDFGNNTILNILKNKKKNKIDYFQKIVELLIRIQSIKDKKIITFKNKIYKLPRYNKKILFEETNLFCDWYVKEKLSKPRYRQFSKEFGTIIKKLILSLKLRNNVFVHRDFHVSNLMLINNKIGVIDSQDALIGNRAYDLASLIDDVRLKTTPLIKNKIYNFYIRRIKKTDTNKFKNDYKILSILRNLKIIGIFTRLAIRDKKAKYLKLIPYSWELINLRIDHNKDFEELKFLLKKYFKNRIK